jgi:septal ring factor EnvC (AmiA/AmiB activator)
VPVVQKEILWSKRTKDKSLIGKVKEVIPQISHSKKWPRFKDGTGKWVNSYSLLQDRFAEGMRAAGFDGFERGERGSTTKHLEVLDYKIQQDKKRSQELSAEVEQKQEAAAALEAKAEKKTARIEKLNRQIAVKEKAKSTIAEVDAMGHALPLVPGVHFTDEEAKRLKSLAKKSVNADERIAKIKRDMAAAEKNLDEVQRQLAEAKAQANHWRGKYTDLWNEVKDFIGAIRKFPSRLREFVSELFRPEREQERQQQKSKSKGMGI